MRTPTTIALATTAAFAAATAAVAGDDSGSTRERLDALHAEVARLRKAAPPPAATTLPATTPRPGPGAEPPGVARPPSRPRE